MDPDRIEYLRKLPIFGALEEETLGELAGWLESAHFEKEQVLFRQGDPGDVLYVIESGQVRIVSNEIQGTEMVFNQFGPGDFFGEMALFDDGPRSAGAVTTTAADLLLLKREHFQRILAEHPLLSAQVAEITETEHFLELQAKARLMRGKVSQSPSE